MLRDSFNHMNPITAIPPTTVSDNTAFVSSIIDMKGFGSLTFAIQTGTLADADATFTVLVEEGDAANLSDAAAVADNHLVGTEALASFAFGDDNETRKLGYVGHRRYIRLTITPANNTGNASVSATAILGHPANMPTANPPQ